MLFFPISFEFTTPRTYADVETAKSPEPMTVTETKSPVPQSPNRSRKSSKASTESAEL